MGVATITFNQIHKSPPKILYLIGGTIAAQGLQVSFGWYAVTCPLLMINLKGKGARMWWIGWNITNIIYVATSNSFLQLFAILTPIILAYHNPAKDRKPTTIAKKFFYFFYQFYLLHLAGLAALRAVI